MKSPDGASHQDYLELAARVLEDAAALCSATTSDLRDLETIRSRVEHEGISFLTISLPAFCSDFERSLARGGVDSKAFPGFKKARAIPAFLQGMLSRLFDQETGRLHDEIPYLESGPVVAAVRQVCRLFAKIELDCTPSRVAQSVAGFVETERALESFSVSPSLQTRFDRVCDYLWAPALRDVPTEWTPRHGPGATAEGVSGNQKYRWLTWHERLEPHFPFIGNAYPATVSGEAVDGLLADLEEVRIVTFAEEGQEEPVKVTPVPKTMKGPRIIAIEPCCMQYAQQSLRRVLYPLVESVTKGRVQFTDQSQNRSLALENSRSGKFSTLDLSEASDRVPHGLALSMFRSVPDFQGAIDACRSRFAKLPDGSIVGPLRKFASMGSALCFPVESMYFYTACVEILLRLQNLPVTRRNVRKIGRCVYVYGDDLVVPTEFAEAIVGCLQEYNCKVNERKSFWSGKFRESCGMDAYDGYEVTPTYVRYAVPNDRRLARQVVSLVETANHFHRKGYWLTSGMLYERLEKLLGPLPPLSADSGGLGRDPAFEPILANVRRKRIRSRWNHDTMRLEVRAWVASPVSRTDEIGGYSALAKCLLTNRGSVSFRRLLEDERLERKLKISVQKDNHLVETERYRSVTLKRRWVAVL